MSDPWVDEWNSMTYTEKLNWWWAARRNYQSQEDFAAGKQAAEGVSCKYGIPGFLPGTRTPYNKPATPTEEVKATEDSNSVEESKVVEETKVTEDTKPADETTTKEETDSTTATAISTDDEKKAGTVNLIIPPGTSTINVNKSNKKKKNKNKH